MSHSQARGVRIWAYLTRYSSTPSTHTNHTLIITDLIFLAQTHLFRISSWISGKQLTPRMSSLLLSLPGHRTCSSPFASHWDMWLGSASCSGGNAGPFPVPTPNPRPLANPVLMPPHLVHTPPSSVCSPVTQPLLNSRGALLGYEVTLLLRPSQKHPQSSLWPTGVCELVPCLLFPSLPFPLRHSAQLYQLFLQALLVPLPPGVNRQLTPPPVPCFSQALTVSGPALGHSVPTWFSSSPLLLTFLPMCFDRETNHGSLPCVTRRCCSASLSTPLSFLSVLQPPCPSSSRVRCLGSQCPCLLREPALAHIGVLTHLRQDTRTPWEPPGLPHACGPAALALSAQESRAPLQQCPACVDTH